MAHSIRLTARTLFDRLVRHPLNDIVLLPARLAFVNRYFRHPDGVAVNAPFTYGFHRPYYCRCFSIDSPVQLETLDHA